LTQRSELLTDMKHRAASLRQQSYLFSRGRRRSVYDKKPPQRTSPKTTSLRLIVRSCKSEAEITIIKDSARGITLFKLTTGGHKASRSFSTTAELLVKILSSADSAVNLQRSDQTSNASLWPILATLVYH